MAQLTRREFLATHAVLAVPLAFFGQQQQVGKRNLLTSAWPATKLTDVLTPRGRFRPFPTVSERSAWEGLPADTRAALVEVGEQQLRTAWEVLPATLFLEYRRTGNRSHYEAARDRRRNKLQDLVIAECVGVRAASWTKSPTEYG